MKKILLVIFIALLNMPTNACTTAVISGKYTKSGRPMLWKNRDTWSINNVLRYFDDGKYQYVGLVNSHDKNGRSVWIGVNSEGFGIMNSASYNLNLDNKEKLSGLEGRIMKEALATCKTLADFEAYLNNLPRPTGLEANFGVIDAQGGAAYYEINNFKYTKLDANDPTVAPFGYIIRTNYSHTGRFGYESSGYIRYNTANKLFYQQSSTFEGLSAQFIQQNVAKGLEHSLIDEDLFDKYGNRAPNHPKYMPFRDYIPRSGSSSSVVVEGVKKDENPNLATLWSNVGFPLSSMMIPTWVNKATLPQIVLYDKERNDSPICDAALNLKKNKIMNLRWGKSDHYYIDVNALANNEGTGIAQITKRYENEIYKRTYKLLEKWRKKGKVNKKDIQEMYKWVNDYVTKAYAKEFDIDLK
jgi:hypothetical protein